MKTVFLFCLTVCFLFSQTYTDVSTTIPDLKKSMVAWGDFDGDEDLDLFIAGVDASDNKFSAIYRTDKNNTTLTFVKVTTGVGIPPLSDGDAHWVDFDRDGDLDLFVTGLDGSNNGVVAIYINENGQFNTLYNQPFEAIGNSRAAWGDIDYDGDLDLVLTGWNPQSSSNVFKVYRNESTANTGGFVDDNVTGVVGYTSGSIDLIDYDGDGDLDLFYSGADHGGVARARLMKNNKPDGEGFTDVTGNIADFKDGTSVWGDFDQDGDLDLFTAGQFNSTTSQLKLYQNNGASFADISTNLNNAGSLGLYKASASAGDYDNDGDLDILVSGVQQNGTPITIFYTNTNNNFDNKQITNIVDLSDGKLAFADIDNDADLDVLTTGKDTGNSNRTKIYQSDMSVIKANGHPSPPTDLNFISGGNALKLEWKYDSGDDKTSPLGIQFNVYVGKSAGADDVVPSHAKVNGYRKVYRMGNAGHNRSITLKLPTGTYFWSVQAIDAAGETSAFAGEQSFSYTSTGNELPQITGFNAEAGDEHVRLTWIKSEIANFKHYQIETFENNNLKYSDQLVDPNTTEFIKNGLTNGTEYAFRILVEDNDNKQSPFSEVRATPQQSGSLPTVTNVRLEAGYEQVTVQWDRSNIPDFKRYIVRYRTNSNDEKFLDVSDQNQQEFQVAGLTNGTTYFFQMAVEDNNNNKSAFSNELSAQPNEALASYIDKVQKLFFVAANIETDTYTRHYVRDALNSNDDFIITIPWGTEGQPNGIEMYFRKRGEKNYTPLNHTRFDLLGAEFRLPANELQHAYSGIDFYFKLNTNDGEKILPKETQHNFNLIHAKVSFSNGFGMDATNEATGDEASYRMISAPFLMQGDYYSIGSFLSDQGIDISSENYNKKEFRLFIWEKDQSNYTELYHGLNSNLPFIRQETNATETIAPNVFILGTRQQKDLVINRAFISKSHKITSWKIPSKKWMAVTTPYYFEISVQEELKRANTNHGYDFSKFFIKRLNGQQFSTAQTIVGTEGYMVFYDGTETEIELFVPDASDASYRGKSAVSETQVEGLRFQLSNGTQVNENTELRFHQEIHVPNLKSPAKTFDISILSQNKKADVVGVPSEGVITLTIENPKSELLTLDIAPLLKTNSNWLLVDDAQGLKYRKGMRATVSEKTKELKLYFGSDDFLASVRSNLKTVPTSYKVSELYPNPFNPNVSIDYELHQSSYVQAFVFDALGRKVKTLISTNQPVGYHQLKWDALNGNGEKVSSGIYYLQLNLNTERFLKRMVLIK